MVGGVYFCMTVSDYGGHNTLRSVASVSKLEIDEWSLNVFA